MITTHVQSLYRNTNDMIFARLDGVAFAPHHVYKGVDHKMALCYYMGIVSIIGALLWIVPI